MIICMNKLHVFSIDLKLKLDSLDWLLNRTFFMHLYYRFCNWFSSHYRKNKKYVILWCAVIRTIWLKTFLFGWSIYMDNMAFEMFWNTGNIWQERGQHVKMSIDFFIDEKYFILTRGRHKFWKTWSDRTWSDRRF